MLPNGGFPHIKLCSQDSEPVQKKESKENRKGQIYYNNFFFFSPSFWNLEPGTPINNNSSIINCILILLFTYIISRLRIK